MNTQQTLISVALAVLGTVGIQAQENEASTQVRQLEQQCPRCGANERVYGRQAHGAEATPLSVDPASQRISNVKSTKRR